MRWSQLKRRTESMFADRVRGRVQLYTTHYRGGESMIHGFERRSWITIDGRPIINMHRHQCRDGVYADSDDPRRLQMGLIGWWDLPVAAWQYLNMSIDDAMASENTMIRALAVLDRRFGRRHLIALDPSSEIPLVAELLRFRLSVAGIASEL
ncbi:MAG TPA: hypothetical protein VK324_15510 [Tepidisphaeraceae bacterium]|nr:hypothetical protein [Tepidisphaeraceae bacterium]